jgi:hypothetical protein
LHLLVFGTYEIAWPGKLPYKTILTGYALTPARVKKLSGLFPRSTGIAKGRIWEEKFNGFN